MNMCESVPSRKPFPKKLSDLLWFDADAREVQLRQLIAERISENPPPHIDDHIVATYFLALRTTPERVGVRLLLAAAVKLYEIGELSSGAAASLAGLPRVAFLSRLADFGVDTFRLTEEELLRETRLA